MITDISKNLKNKLENLDQKGSFVNMKTGQGKMKTTDFGAKRESNDGRGRFDLLPYEALEALSKWYEQGADKYGERNWEKGISVKDCINRMIRHAIKAGNGWTDEDHLSAVMWNAAAAITMIQRKPECNDHIWIDSDKTNTIFFADGKTSTKEDPDVSHEDIYHQFRQVYNHLNDNDIYRWDISNFNSKTISVHLKNGFTIQYTYDKDLKPSAPIFDEYNGLSGSDIYVQFVERYDFLPAGSITHFEIHPDKDDTIIVYFTDGDSIVYTYEYESDSLNNKRSKNRTI